MYSVELLKTLSECRFYFFGRTELTNRARLLSDDARITSYAGAFVRSQFNAAS